MNGQSAPNAPSFHYIVRMTIDAKTLWTVIIGSLLVAGAIWIAIDFFSAPSNHDDRIAEVGEILQEYQRLIENRSGEMAWNDFQDWAIPELEEITDELEPLVENGDQTTLDLLRLTRDILPGVITKGSEAKPSRQELGQSLLARIEQQQEAVKLRRANEIGLLEQSILLFDGLLILLIGRWFLARRSRAM